MESPLSLANRRRTTVVVCIVLLLLAMTLQVAHHCSLNELSTGHHAGDDFAPAASTCVICMTAQIATLAVAALVLAGLSSIHIDAVVYAEIPGERLADFALCIRPPPAF